LIQRQSCELDDREIVVHLWWGEEIFVLIRDLDWLWSPATLSSAKAGGTAGGE